MTTHERPVALVTGSGRGIGSGIALRLAREGYAVVINARTDNPDAPDGSPSRLKAQIEAEGGEAFIHLADIGDLATHAPMIEAVIGRFGRLDLLVNNAGVAPSVRADILEADEASFDRLMRINLKGPYFLTQTAVRRMIELRDAGCVPTPRIVFVTSISVYTSSTNRGDYCISKAGLAMAVQLFADRLAPEGIPVIEVRPGIVRTSMTSAVQDKYDRLIAEGLVPMRRWGTPEDIASAVAAVARGDLDFCTGSAIEAGGGIHMRRL